MYEISKRFEFCYGHRVYSQNVVEKYALDSECPCQRIHGHQGAVTVGISAAKLDERGFVIDFKELSFVKQFIDNNIDHRFILSASDPNFGIITGGFDLSDLDLSPVYLLDNVLMGHRVNLERMGFINENIQKHLSSFFIVDFNPTSEELSRWIYEGVGAVLLHSPFIQATMKEVVWSETPKTRAVYS